MFRAARTLVFLRESRELVGFNYFTRQTFACSADLIAFLDQLQDWATFDEICASNPLFDPDELQQQVQALLDVSALVARDSRPHREEALYEENWTWGVPTILFHQTVQDRPYLSLAEATDIQKARLEERPAPSLSMSAGIQSDDVIDLEHASDDALLSLMAKRRTVRESDGAAISLEQITDCLYAGLGITGSVTNDAGITLPLGMTPSGGARNPFEAYVCAREIDGLASGFFHYSAKDHALTRIRTNQAPSLASLAGDQEWADDLPCMIILVGFLDRPMWKYHDANAYRVTLIEAGHIGQNIMLAATQHGLSACPTAALNHSLISECLELESGLFQTPIYGLALSRPAPESAVMATSFYQAGVAEFAN
ncbi:MAG: SagB family peptide dehydrogenase [Pseudomonadota bacterium]